MQAEERARQQLKEAEMKGLEDAVVKQEKMQACMLALKSAKRDVQDALMDCITSLQAELKKYDENCIKLQKETNERYNTKKNPESSRFDQKPPRGN